MRHTLILHNRRNICEVEIDEAWNIDQIRDALYSLLENLVGLLQCIRHRGSAIYDLKQTVIRDDDQGVYGLLQLLDAIDRVRHTLTSLETERLRHDADGKDTHILRDLRDDRSCTGSGSATHTTGNEYHIGTLQCSGDILRALLCSLRAYLWSAAAAESLRQLLADLHRGRCLAVLKRLLIGIDADELDAHDTIRHHAVYRVVTCATNTYDDNLCSCL